MAVALAMLPVTSLPTYCAHYQRCQREPQSATPGRNGAPKALIHACGCVYVCVCHLHNTQPLLHVRNMELYFMCKKEPSC